MDLPHHIQCWNGRRVIPDATATLPRLASEPTLVNMDTAARRTPPYYPRLLYKCGGYTLIGKNIPNLTSRFITDFWNTLLDMRWLMIMLLFLISNFILWLVFAAIFWIISFAHGDFEEDNKSSDERCIIFERNSTSFAAAFLFSVETLRTIGFGTPRYPTDECPGTLFFLCFGVLVSCLLESVLVGLLLAKTHIPQKRSATLMFSENAVICTREGQMCLLFRIGNVRSSLLFRVELKAYLVYAKRTEEGEEMPFHQHEIQLQIDANGDGVYLGWPITACHVINSSSPFYHVSKKNLERAAFEIIVILEGIVESTGASIQARTSYIPDEIIWGRHFKSCYEDQMIHGKALFDFTHFDTTISQLHMRDLSAFELDELHELKLNLKPTIVLSNVDQVDSGYELQQETAMSPSLAKALDIQYEAPRSRAGSFSTRRISVQSRPSVFGKPQLALRRISRVEPVGLGHLRLPHVCHLPVVDSPEQPMRRVATSLGPVNSQRLDSQTHVRRRISHI